MVNHDRQGVVMLLVDGDRFLAIKRAPGVPEPGYWAPPSGKIEAGETQRDAVQREAMEEVGLAVEPVRKVWECRSANGLYLLHWWSARPASVDLVPDEREVADARWVTADEFTTLGKTFPADREFFEHVFPDVISPGGDLG